MEMGTDRKIELMYAYSRHWFQRDDVRHYARAEFVGQWNLSMPLVELIHEGFAIPTEEGEVIIQECWENLCLDLGIPAQNNYNSLEEML